MKRNLLYLLPLFLLLILVEACSTKNDNIPIPTPLGTFKGKFRLLVKKANGTGVDTVKKDSLLTLKLSTPNNFAITGDTAVIHAGSHGLFQYDGYYMAFLDSTYSTRPQAKIHLVGTYQYFYNGSILQLLRTNSTQDSVLRYDFTKISN